MKTCRMCGEDKPLEDFPRQRDTRDGRYSYCKACKAAWLRKDRRENPERWQEYNRRFKAKNRDRINDQRRARYAADPRKALASYVKRAYRLTLEEYDAIVAKPCGLCGASEKIVLDHCHDTNRVRGPLCQTCNKALGMLGDDPTRLREAADYLERK